MNNIKLLGITYLFAIFFGVSLSAATSYLVNETGGPIKIHFLESHAKPKPGQETVLDIGEKYVFAFDDTTPKALAIPSNLSIMRWGVASSLISSYYPQDMSKIIDKVRADINQDPKRQEQDLRLAIKGDWKNYYIDIEWVKP